MIHLSIDFCCHAKGRGRLSRSDVDLHRFLSLINNLYHSTPHTKGASPDNGLRPLPPAPPLKGFGRQRLVNRSWKSGSLQIDSSWGPGRLGWTLGGLRGILVPFWGSWGHLGSLWQGWGHFGPSWAVLAPIWGVLGVRGLSPPIFTAHPSQQTTNDGKAII